MRALLPVSLTLLVGLLAACGASMMRRPDSPSTPYGPANKTSTGLVKYLADGADFVVQKRRRDAYESMHRECGGSYEIVEEWVEEEGTAGSAYATPLGSGAMAFGSSAPIRYAYISYECQARGKAAGGLNAPCPCGPSFACAVVATRAHGDQALCRPRCSFPEGETCGPSEDCFELEGSDEFGVCLPVSRVPAPSKLVFPAPTPPSDSAPPSASPPLSPSPSSLSPSAPAITASDRGVLIAVINDQKLVVETLWGKKLYDAKTFCLGFEESDEVLFLEHPDACATNTLVNLRSGNKCEVFCE